MDRADGGHDEAAIRSYAAEYKPGHRLRVTRFTAETEWTDDGGE